MSEALNTESDRQSSEDIKTVARGGAITLIGSLFGRGIDLTLMVILARILGTYEYGLYAIGLNIFRISGLIAPLGLDRGVIRFGAKKGVPRNWVIYKSLQISFVLSAIIGTLLFVSATWIAAQFDEPELKNIIQVIATTVPFLGCMMVAIGATMLSKRMEFAVVARDIVQPLINLSLILIFALIGIKAKQAAWALNISYAAGFLVAIYFVFKLTNSNASKKLESSTIKLPHPRVKDLIQFSVLATFAGIVVNLTTRTDRLMVGFLLSAEDAGVYQAAAQSATLSLIIMGALNSIFIPMIVELNDGNHKERLNHMYKLVTRWTLYLSLPISLIFFFSADSFMSVIFGEAYAAGATVLIIIALGQLVNAGTGAVGPLLIMTGHQSLWFFLALVALVSNILLNLLLIPTYGLVGASISSLIAIFGLYSLGLMFAKARLGLWPYSYKYRKGIIAAVIVALALWLLREWAMNISLLFHLVLTIMLSTIGFFMLLAIQRFEQEDHEFLVMLRLKKKKKV